MSSAMTNATTGCLGECPAGRFRKTSLEQLLCTANNVHQGSTSRARCHIIIGVHTLPKWDVVWKWISCMHCMSNWKIIANKIGFCRSMRALRVGNIITVAVYHAHYVRGYFTDTPGASQCSMCELGTYGDKVGMTSCPKCARGRYSSLTPIDSCLTCKRAHIAVKQV